ncbi:MAG: 4-(cytidine 5'-diphospho)-2-C-methyl-D-erythritol kinase [Cryomorphaceae bacterium]|nr:4-(cytidine 5'-diphospho)-2-C-methyl-D-erythritol kinase [Cryomorphaceae bacterium]
MIRFASSKINIGLRVTEKRPDGFHNIESIFYPIPLNDVMEAVPATTDDLSLQTEGIHIDGDVKQNLVFKAWQLLRDQHAISGNKAALLKCIPTGAGLGGGSSDAANMLLLLNDLHNLNLSTPQLEKYAAMLGSDCPFFIENKPKYVTGRGEILSPIALSLAGYYLLLIHPKVHVSTPVAYSMITPYAADVDLREIIELPVDQWHTIAKNDFQTPMCNAFPAIREALDIVTSATPLFSSMTGSGSAVYGIFEKEPAMPVIPENWFSKIVKL